MSSPKPQTQVLIVGAGPTGLVLALWLTRLGVRVRIVDKSAESGTTSRAVAVQARTLELYSQIGIAKEVVERGLEVGGANLWVAGKQVAHIVFGALGAGLSPFPYALTFPQDEHESLLIDHLAKLNVTVERRTEVTAFEETKDGLLVNINRPEGSREVVEAAYLAGCDGAHSIVRANSQIGFPGGTYEHVFYVADVQASGPVMNREVHVALDKTDFLAAFPLKGEGRARLVGALRDDAGATSDNLSWNDVSKRVIDWMKIDVARVNWFSTYRVHHRVADHFRKGRAFLLGDAAHIHSPVGGQGMNTGIGDAVNLAWKLAVVLHGRADPSLLDSYEPERIAFARRLVETTDRAFTAVTSPSALATLVRLHIVPFVLPILSRSAAVRRLLFRTVSQTGVSYHGSSLSEGRAGAVRGGDRLPWVPPDSDGMDNFSSLESLSWQAHVYGTASPALKRVCNDRDLRLHEFAWRREMRHVGLERDSVYLVRPDGYVALADPNADTATITAYLDGRSLLRTR